MVLDTSSKTTTVTDENGNEVRAPNLDEQQAQTEALTNGTSGESASTTVDTGGTTLPDVPVKDGEEALVQASNGNSAPVHVGFGGGHVELPAGQGLTVPVTNLNLLTVVADSGTQTVNYMAVQP